MDNQLSRPGDGYRYPTQMNAPHSYVVVCELHTGIVLKQVDNGWSRILNGDGGTHIPFASIDEAKRFVRSTIALDGTLECNLFDVDKEHVARYFESNLP
ncbi:hypothetical protein Enr13x_10900 [Stieleria neptunia]|uniref:Uncharacterized protein n=1 Tax=Stieleria neptunia TaxID=2527979 RepID=A0A518HK57_9BACT|nr:hypothetical protein [Stieleria neptunia]QDV41252.1 hypothetical protein Enr13x_10900 [Stieleria neptunia]